MTDHSNDPGVAEHKKIRQYVINLIYNAGDDVRELPSSRELALRFGVSHPTVLRALQDLRDDGFLVKQGRRTVTRPICRFQDESLRIFGVGSGDGQEVLQSKVSLMFSNILSLTMLDRNAEFRLQPLTLPRSIPSLAEHIRQYSLAGLLWTLPESGTALKLQQAKAAGLPVAVMGSRIEGVSCAGWNAIKEYELIMARLLADGCRKPLVINIHFDEAVRDDVVTGVQNACAAAGFPFQECLMLRGDENQEMLQRLTELLSYGVKPDAVVFSGMIHPYLNILREKLDTVNACRLIGWEYALFDSMRFEGTIIRHNLRQAAELLIDNLLEQYSRPQTAPVLNADIPVELTAVNASTNYR